MITLKCKKHPAYMAVYPPQQATKCLACWRLYAITGEFYANDQIKLSDGSILVMSALRRSK